MGGTITNLRGFLGYGIRKENIMRITQKNRTNENRLSIH